MMRTGSALFLAGFLATSAAQAFGGAALSSKPASVVKVQYGGPMDDGPGYGPSPGYGPRPGYGPGPGYGGGRPGDGGGESGPARRHSAQAKGSFTSYHGFRIDLSEAQGTIDVPSALAEVDHQIDIVDRVGLGSAMLQRFRSFPIHLTASFVGRGSHYSGGSEVFLGSMKPDDDRPILLHEYMHVLHFRFLPGSNLNPDIRRFYEEAKARGLYEPGSYMLSNPAEFFAMTASCYLNGTVARAPYDRAAIEQAQPDYYAYLAHLFGHGGAASAARPATEAALH